MVRVRAERRVVWVVEDSPVDASLVRQALEPTYGVELFADGSAVLEQLAAQRAPDVLILDWILPGVSGIEVLRFLRAPGGRHVDLPILLLTGRSDTDQVVEGLGAGADDFVAKPFVGAELVARVGALLRGRELRERLEQAEASVRKLLATAPDPLVAVDSQGRITFANAQASRILGVADEELLGRAIHLVLPGLALRNISLGQGESLFPLPDVEVGDRVYAPFVRVLPSDDAANTTIALRDVTEQRRAEERRLDFYSMIAHDLRSPLASALLRLEVLLSGRRGLLPADVQRDLRKMDDSLRALVAMINDFLELARLEGVGYKIAHEIVDVGEVVEATLREFEPLLSAKKLALRFEPPPAATTTMGDRQRLVQVVANLVGNSVKFTPPNGRIEVVVGRGATFCEIIVRDDGEGIEAERLPHIFERYVTGGSRAGTGLGLMIVREIVEAHGGTVGVESKLGEGSTFWVRLPLFGAGRATASHEEISATPVP